MKLSNLLITTLIASTTISSCVTQKAEKKQKNELSELKKDSIAQFKKDSITKKEFEESCIGCGMG